MEFLIKLWLPILLTGVAVFAASSVVHMLLKYHARDYHGLPNEDKVRAALREGGPGPGMYCVPYASSMKAMGDPEFQKKCTDGPVGIMILGKPGKATMGPQLMQWFVFSVVVAIVAAYLASRAVGAGAPYLAVFRVVGTLTFMAYGGAYVSWSIWYRMPWAATGRYLLDALIYALVSGGVFGSLWPSA